MKTTFNFPPEIELEIRRPGVSVTQTKMPEDEVAAFLRFFVSEGVKVKAPITLSSFTAEDRKHAKHLLEKFDRPLLVWSVSEFWLKHSQPLFDRYPGGVNILRYFRSMIPVIVANG